MLLRLESLASLRAIGYLRQLKKVCAPVQTLGLMQRRWWGGPPAEV